MDGASSAAAAPAPCPRRGHCGSLPAVVAGLQAIAERFGPYSPGGATGGGGGGGGFQGRGAVAGRAPWSLVCCGALEVLRVFPTGVTEAVLVCELQTLLRKRLKSRAGTIGAVLDGGKVDQSTVIDATVTAIATVESGGA